MSDVTGNRGFILNSVIPATSDILQFLVQFNSRWILEFIKLASDDLQKLLECFSGTTIFVFFNVPSSTWFPKILDLYLKDDSQDFQHLLQMIHPFQIAINLHMYPNNYHYIQ